MPALQAAILFSQQNQYKNLLYENQAPDECGLMYDKFGIILRIETTTNDIYQFRHYLELQHLDGSKAKKLH
jgi:hypothetical protein